MGQRRRRHARRRSSSTRHPAAPRLRRAGGAWGDRPRRDAPVRRGPPRRALSAPPRRGAGQVPGHRDGAERGRRRSARAALAHGWSGARVPDERRRRGLRRRPRRRATSATVRGPLGATRRSALVAARRRHGDPRVRRGRRPRAASPRPRRRARPRRRPTGSASCSPRPSPRARPRSSSAAAAPRRPTAVAGCIDALDALGVTIDGAARRRLRRRRDGSSTPRRGFGPQKGATPDAGARASRRASTTLAGALPRPLRRRRDRRATAPARPAGSPVGSSRWAPTVVSARAARRRRRRPRRTCSTAPTWSSPARAASTAGPSRARSWPTVLVAAARDSPPSSSPGRADAVRGRRAAARAVGPRRGRRARRAPRSARRARPQRSTAATGRGSAPSPDASGSAQPPRPVARLGGAGRGVEAEPREDRLGRRAVSDHHARRAHTTRCARRADAVGCAGGVSTSSASTAPCRRPARARTRRAPTRARRTCGPGGPWVPQVPTTTPSSTTRNATAPRSRAASASTCPRPREPLGHRSDRRARAAQLRRDDVVDREQRDDAAHMAPSRRSTDSRSSDFCLAQLAQEREPRAVARHLEQDLEVAQRQRAHRAQHPRRRRRESSSRRSMHGLASPSVNSDCSRRSTLTAHSAARTSAWDTSGSSTGIGSTIAFGYGSSAKPLDDADPLDAAGDKDPPVVFERRGELDAHLGADRDALVAATHLAATRDEADAELLGVGHHVAREALVAALEDVERQLGGGEDDRGEREHRERLGRHGREPMHDGDPKRRSVGVPVAAL